MQRASSLQEADDASWINPYCYFPYSQPLYYPACYPHFPPQAPYRHPSFIYNRRNPEFPPNYQSQSDHHSRYFEYHPNNSHHFYDGRSIPSTSLDFNQFSKSTPDLSLPDDDDNIPHYRKSTTTNTTTTTTTTSTTTTEVSTVAAPIGDDDFLTNDEVNGVGCSVTKMITSNDIHHRRKKYRKKRAPLPPAASSSQFTEQVDSIEMKMQTVAEQDCHQNFIITIGKTPPKIRVEDLDVDDKHEYYEVNDEKMNKVDDKKSKLEKLLSKSRPGILTVCQQQHKRDDCDGGSSTTSDDLSSIQSEVYDHAAVSSSEDSTVNRYYEEKLYKNN